MSDRLSSWNPRGPPWTRSAERGMVQHRTPTHSSGCIYIYKRFRNFSQLAGTLSLLANGIFIPKRHCRIIRYTWVAVLFALSTAALHMGILKTALEKHYTIQEVDTQSAQGDLLMSCPITNKTFVVEVEASARQGEHDWLKDSAPWVILHAVPDGEQRRCKGHAERDLKNNSPTSARPNSESLHGDQVTDRATQHHLRLCQT